MGATLMSELDHDGPSQLGIEVYAPPPPPPIPAPRWQRIIGKSIAAVAAIFEIGAFHIGEFGRQLTLDKAQPAPPEIILDEGRRKLEPWQIPMTESGDPQQRAEADAIAKRDPTVLPQPGDILQPRKTQ